MENGEWERDATSAAHFPFSILHFRLFLELDHLHGFKNSIRTLLERRFLVRGEVDLDDLLEAFASELAWDAEEEPFHAVFPLEPRGARQNPSLILNDRFRHLHGAGRRRVIG